MSDNTPPRVSPSSRNYADDSRHASAESIPELLRDVANDFSTLFSKELALAKAELREAATEAKTGVIAMSGGAGLAFAGVLIVLLAAVYALGNVVPMWAAALIVGVVALAIGYGMIKAAQKKMEPSAFVPERTAESVRKDKETAKETAKRVVQ